MTDKAAVSGPDSTTTTPAVREAAIGAALSGVLLPELTRIVCAYARRPGHRFDAETASRIATVSGDGKQSETARQTHEPEASDVSVHFVWSRYTLLDGARHWRVQMPLARCCFLGVADVRSRPSASASAALGAPPADPTFRPEMLYVGQWNAPRVHFHAGLKSVPRGAHRHMTIRSYSYAIRVDVTGNRLSCSARSMPTLALCGWRSLRSLRPVC
jgi:hypothetical protein